MNNATTPVSITIEYNGDEQTLLATPSTFKGKDGELVTCPSGAQYVIERSTAGGTRAPYWSALKVRSTRGESLVLARGTAIIHRTKTEILLALARH
jgi:hypothetical protein